MKKELELYIHIPFCTKKCDYCDFLSGPSGEEEREVYVEALIDEIYSHETCAGNYEITSIFIGGGTPSILNEEQIRRLFLALSDVFTIALGAEISIEMNPGSATRDKLSTYRVLGINRLSIGLQSANDRELKRLGRIHTWEEFEHTYQTAREQGFVNVNVDLMSSIPGQHTADWDKTLTRVLHLKPQPEHISVYSLIVEPGTPFYEQYEQQLLPLPDEDTQQRIDKLTERSLWKAGYRQYEISNYAKSGYESRHNLGYWDRKEYLGLGLGAASFMNHERFQNTRDMSEYLKGMGRPDHKERLTLKEEMEEFMFLGLRKTKGIRTEDFEDAFQMPIEEVYRSELAKLEAEQLLTRQGSYIRLTKRGREVGNYVFAEFVKEG